MPICLSNTGSEMITCKLRHNLVLSTSMEWSKSTFQELLRFYTKHGSAMHVAFLDASKAFGLIYF